MSITRKLVKIYTPPGQPGFLGAGHVARPVINGNFSDSDPFIILMDDILDKNDNEPVGGPHPHAGFETVSLLLEGEMGDEPYKMKSGDLQIMTARQRCRSYGNHRKEDENEAVATVVKSSKKRQGCSSAASTFIF